MINDKITQIIQKYFKDYNSLVGQYDEYTCFTPDYRKTIKLIETFVKFYEEIKMIGLDINIFLTLVQQDTIEVSFDVTHPKIEKSIKSKYRFYFSEIIFWKILEVDQENKLTKNMIKQLLQYPSVVWALKRVVSRISENVFKIFCRL